MRNYGMHIWKGINHGIKPRFFWTAVVKIAVSQLEAIAYVSIFIQPMILVACSTASKKMNNSRKTFIKENLHGQSPLMQLLNAY